MAREQKDSEYEAELAAAAGTSLRIEEVDDAESGSAPAADSARAAAGDAGGVAPHVSSVEAPAASPAAASSAAYAFETAATRHPELDDKAAVERWTKWDLHERRVVADFRFRGSRFVPGEAAAFLLDFFNDPAVRAALPVVATKGAAPAPLPAGVRVAQVRFEPLRATLTNMGFFDRLVDAGILVRVDADAGAAATGGSGADPAAGSGDEDEPRPLIIRKQLEEIVEGVTVGDQLRSALLAPEGSGSEHGDLFDESTEQSELLYRVFRHVTLGGAMCQYEDDARPYLAAAKDLYRALVSVGKDPSSGRVAVQSVAFAVTGLTAAPDAAAAGAASASGSAAAARPKPLPLFPNSSPLNVCWIVVHPAAFRVTAYYWPWLPFW